MQSPAEIVFRDIPRSEALEKNIRERIKKLEKMFDHITSCNVIIEETHQHKHQGKLFHVRINVHVPDKELVVSREKHDKQEHEDPYIAVRDAFNAMQRQLDDHSRKMRRDVKLHSLPSSELLDADMSLDVSADNFKVAEG